MERTRSDVRVCHGMRSVGCAHSMQRACMAIGANRRERTARHLAPRVFRPRRSPRRYNSVEPPPVQAAPARPGVSARRPNRMPFLTPPAPRRHTLHGCVGRFGAHVERVVVLLVRAAGIGAVSRDEHRVDVGRQQVTASTWCVAHDKACVLYKPVRGVLSTGHEHHESDRLNATSSLIQWSVEDDASTS